MPSEKRKDPICGMTGHINAHGKWFCSEGCVRKYESQNRIKKDLYCPECAVHATHGHGVPKPWYRERLWQVLISLAGLLAAHLVLSAFSIPLLNGFWMAFYEYFALIWWAILAGFIIGGFIDYLVPTSYVSKFLSNNEKRTIVWSVVLGFLMSACCHGILAIAIELYRKGASVPAVVAFLLASPWANLPITILLFGFFGLKAFLIVFSAIVIAIITGLVFQGLDRMGWIERSKHTSHVTSDFSVKRDMAARWKSYLRKPNNGRVAGGILRGSWWLTRMVMWWILIGITAAAFVHVIIPENLFAIYMGPTIIGLLVTLVVATVIEVCSEGSSPLSFEIYRQTGAFGNTFTFLMAGVATDYTEIGLIASNIGRKTALMIPLVTVPQVLAIGYLFNILI